MVQNDNFTKRQEEAVNQMREMSRRATGGFHNMPPAPPFVKLPDRPQNTAPVEEAPKQSASATPKSRQNDGITAFLSGMNLPFLNNLKNDQDITLVLGLLLILISEKSDRLLMLALLYILL